MSDDTKHDTSEVCHTSRDALWRDSGTACGDCRVIGCHVCPDCQASRRQALRARITELESSLTSALKERDEARQMCIEAHGKLRRLADDGVIEE